MTFCAITPTRGDRPELLEHCKWQVSRMTLRPEKHFIIDYPPKNGNKDLVERLQFGISLAKEYEWAFIIEDDDFYGADYFERLYRHDADFVGDDRTLYYNIRNNGYETTHHKGRASLFTTGFRLSSLKNFDWTRIKPGSVWADIALWNHASSKAIRKKFVDSGTIGIKHGQGLTGGIGHRQRYRTFDNNWNVLASKVDAESLEFYKNLQKKLL